MKNKHQKQKGFVEGRGYAKGDWNAVDSPELTDEELANMKPATEVLPAEFFKAVEDTRRSRGRPKVDAPKEAVTLRLSPALVARFKASGKDWRAKMSEALEKAKI